MINVRIPVTATVSSPRRIPEKPAPAMVKKLMPAPRQKPLNGGRSAIAVERVSLHS